MKPLALIALLLLSPPCAALADDPPQPAAILAEALTAAGAIDDHDDRALALVLIAAAQSLTGEALKARTTMDEAVAAAHAMDDPGRDWTLRIIAAFQAGSWVEGRAGEFLSGVKQFMDSFGALGERTNSNPPDFKAIDPDSALSTAKAIKDAKHRLWALWFIARPLIEARAWPELRPVIYEAQAAAEQLADRESRAEVLAIVGWVQHLTGDRPGSVATLARAAELADALDSGEPRAEAFRYIAAAARAMGNSEVASALIRQAIVAAVPAKADASLRKIAVWQAGTGDTSGALATIDQMGAAEARIGALYYVLGVQLLASDLEAETTLQKIATEGPEVTADTRWFLAVVQTARSQAALNRDTISRDAIAAALAVLELKLLELWVPSLVGVAPVLERSVDRLLPAIKIIEDVDDGTDTLVLSLALMVAGRSSVLAPYWSETAVAILFRTKSGSDPFLKSWMLAEIGHSTAANEAMIEARSSPLDASEGSRAQHEALLLLAATQARLGHPADAVTTAREIGDPVFRAKALAVVAMSGRFAPFVMDFNTLN